MKEKLEVIECRVNALENRVQKLLRISHAVTDRDEWQARAIRAELELKDCQEYIRDLKSKFNQVEKELVSLKENSEQTVKEPPTLLRIDSRIILSNARRLIKKSMKTKPNWYVMSALFAIGSCSAGDLCRAKGIDPDGFTI